MLDSGTREILLDEAKTARRASYSPYSEFSVGAALLCDDGSVSRGCNVENASYGATCCAERVAVFSAIANKKRGFKAIAIVGNKAPCMPCGVCRQVMAEFCTPDFEIVFEKEDGRADSITLGELLPHAFEMK